MGASINSDQSVASTFEDINWVWERFGRKIAKPTLYEWSRADPARWGARREGRRVLFRREAIDQIIAGER